MRNRLSFAVAHRVDTIVALLVVAYRVGLKLREYSDQIDWFSGHTSLSVRSYGLYYKELPV